MRRLALVVLVAASVAPSALALDVLPEATRLGAHEGLVIVRASGTLRVEADAAVEVAVAQGDFVPAPAALDVAGAPAWHGLQGAVEVRLRREDASREARIEMDDGATGVILEWPAKRRTDGAPMLVALILASGVMLVAPARRDRS